MINVDLPTISAQIRELRLRHSLTLQEAADRAGTSAPTMHRYESGWDRFELRTLHRIADALEADVEVRLVPRSGDRSGDRSGSQPGDQFAPDQATLTAAELIDLLDSVFWDADPQPADLARYPGWVLERALVFGNQTQVKAARAYFGDSALAAALGRRGVDARTRNYWRLVLEDECIPGC